MKRVFDVVGALCGLLFIAPFTPFIALTIVLDDGFPVFVKIDRVSEGKIIKVYKFRTMIRNAREVEEGLRHLNERKDGPFFKIKDNPCITKVGRFLRKLRVDEFPQFLNVLKGELALVGPRPHEPEEVVQYPPEFREILFAKAGVTGLSQVSGASALPYKKELELDLYYVRNQSLWFDFKIVLRSVWVFFSDPTGV